MTSNNGNIFKHAVSGGVAVVKKLRLGSAVDSDVAILIVIAPVLGIVVAFTQLWLLFLILLVPLVGYLRHYDYFMKNNPTMLRSEKHTENMRRIEISAMGNDEDVIQGEAFEELPSATGAMQKLTKGEKK